MPKQPTNKRSNNVTMTKRRISEHSVSSDNNPTTQPVERFVRREVWLAFLLLVLLFAAVAIAGKFLRSEVVAFATWMYDHLGLIGLTMLFLVSETVVSPMPPEVFLLIVAGSELSRAWFGPVTVLALASTVGGNLGWLLGLGLRETGLVHRILGRHHGRSVELMRRFGIWAVVLAATTPIPWSVTSWTAGALHMPWRRYALGSLFRLPRIILYYLSIHAAFHGLWP
jgi:membrane protein YqaA with SNARE-associated domain